MKRRWVIVLAAVAAVVLVGGAGALYAYDSTQSDLIADGITVGGVDVGAMRAGEARLKLSREVAPRLERGLTAYYGRHRFLLSPAELGLRADVDAMVREALDRSRSGTFVGRALRELSGGKVDARLPARADYSEQALASFVRAVGRSLNRPLRDASIRPTGSGVNLRPSLDGLVVRKHRFAHNIAAQLVRPSAPHRLRVSVARTKPRVTTAKLARRYPTFITISRPERRLRLFKHLRLRKTYIIAVGMIGLETPAGLYHVIDREINPSWHVPNSPWAGGLAGRVIPPGPDDPLKARWLGIYDGAGIHGTDVISSLGTAASHGCIRMSIPDVIELYDLVPMHTPVYVG